LLARVGRESVGGEQDLETARRVAIRRDERCRAQSGRERRCVRIDRRLAQRVREIRRRTRFRDDARVASERDDRDAVVAAESVDERHEFVRAARARAATRGRIVDEHAHHRPAARARRDVKSGRCRDDCGRREERARRARGAGVQSGCHS
jgi:hypothetical protein